MQVSLKDVAARAGVSAATVSRVLNDKAQEIPEHTRERVRLIAAELGYRPNRLARSLQARSTNIIGIMVGGIGNPFFAEMLETAEEMAAQAGYQVVSDSAIRRDIYPDVGNLQGWPVDGVLMWSGPTWNLAQFLHSQAENLPVVYMGYERTDGADYVAFDRSGGMRDLMAHLIGRGYRKIAYATPQPAGESDSIEGRLLPYREACQAAGIEPRIIPLYEDAGTRRADRGNGSRAQGYDAGLALADLPPGERPDAVFCFNDPIALGMREGLRRKGLRLPLDIAVAGFDGLAEGQYLSERLTTVETPIEPLCERAVELLVRRMKGGSRIPPQQSTLPSKLIIGETT